MIWFQGFNQRTQGRKDENFKNSKGREEINKGWVNFITACLKT